MKSNFENSLSQLYKEDINNFEKSLQNKNVIDFVDKDGRTLIFYAILQGNFEAVKILINNNAELNLKDNNGWAPLHYAVNEYHPVIVEHLIKNGADINAKDKFGNTVISRAVYSSKGKGEIIKLLLEYNADPSIKNDSDMNAYDLSEIISNYDVKKFLTL